ncbi:hypothetical protein I4U23_003329 [Adineta vaga]|nr:hypothetical protein I4U23_003329 [Adineta vaga]
MARRDDHYRHHRHQQQLHYASILPAPNHTHTYTDPRVARRSNEQDQQKAFYVEFENAFQDQTTNQDYFGCQSLEQTQHNNQLQSVETISEIENRNLIPYFRYQATRESSHHSSTPSDTPPYLPRHNHGSAPTSNHHHHHHYFSPTDSRENLHHDFTNLNLFHTSDNKDMTSPFTSDAIRIKSKPQETIPNSSSQVKLTLPQYFLVKYLGRTPCTQLWGSKVVRTPIDDMVRAARQLPSMNELPTLEACVNYRGFTLTHRHSPTRNKHQHHSRNHSPERHHHGLVPLENISYVMHDIKYSKIATCIVLRQVKVASPDRTTTNETLTECYAFLFQSKEHAHRFALTLAEAFSAQKQSIRPSRQQHDEKREGRSPQRRSRPRHVHHHNNRYDEKYLRDSQA